MSRTRTKKAVIVIRAREYTNIHKYTATRSVIEGWTFGFVSMIQPRGNAQTKIHPRRVRDSVSARGGTLEGGFARRRLLYAEHNLFIYHVARARVRIISELTRTRTRTGRWSNRRALSRPPLANFRYARFYWRVASAQGDQLCR